MPTIVPSTIVWVSIITFPPRLQQQQLQLSIIIIVVLLSVNNPVLKLSTLSSPTIIWTHYLIKAIPIIAKTFLSMLPNRFIKRITNLAQKTTPIVKDSHTSHLKSIKISSNVRRNSCLLMITSDSIHITLFFCIFPWYLFISSLILIQLNIFNKERREGRGRGWWNFINKSINFYLKFRWLKMYYLLIMWVISA